jgi:hypothetical protein
MVAGDSRPAILNQAVPGPEGAPRRRRESLVVCGCTAVHRCTTTAVGVYMFESSKVESAEPREQ